MTIYKQGKCDSCGDITTLHSYNGSNSCKHCLSMDSRGVGRRDILKSVLNANNDKLRRNRSKNRKAGR